MKSFYVCLTNLSIISSTSQKGHLNEMKKLPVIADGPRIFEIWKKTLIYWLSNDKNKVYLATPFLDKDILKEFLDIFLKGKASIGNFFVREECCEIYDEKTKVKSRLKFQEIWKEIIKTFSDEDKKILIEKVWPNMQVKKGINYFHAKFIGCVNTTTGVAEVLLTSANFNTTHFRPYTNGGKNHDSIGFHRMLKAEFEEKILNPISQL